MNTHKMKILFALLTLIVALVKATVINERDATSSDSTYITKIFETDVYKTPAVIFFGKFNGEIVRCQKDQCEIFHKANRTDSIYSLHISGEYIYAGLFSGDILKCHLYTKHSCKIFYPGSRPTPLNTPVFSLTSVRGHLFAGLDDVSDGTIMMCEKHQTDCRPLHKLRNTPVPALTQIGDNIYAGGGGMKVIRCSLTLDHCTQVYENSDRKKVTMGIANMDNVMYLLEHTGVLWKCPRTFNTITNCIHVYLNTNGGYTWTMVAFNASVYVLGGMGICDVNTGNCVSYTNQKEFRSMAMVYKTHHMQSNYKEEDSCQDVQCELVTYYNENERAAFKVHVKDGRLYNANDSFVDTSDADQGKTGPAAIFIMAPEGKIFLSNHHQGINTSSFLAGNPVSGAGEIVVEKGVIKKITACSNHYKPDVELNKQVIQSLITQGYTEPIVLDMCNEIKN
ncbi:uncharacterized protein LOC134752721 isoform X1 [Cydia strobilella]|uniref:uncharacterized protein LOC134752721 isoform X1 n=1 Tax=Cydia strobilella TaxID=1100964 RepID=UPI0030075D99